MKLTITGYSTALYSSWMYFDELSLLLDAGDGITSGLLQKSRKVKNAFITHPDRDHLNGLPQFVQLNAREHFPNIHFPKDSGSFPAMQNFLELFDRHVHTCNWIGIEDQQEIAIGTNVFVKAVRNEHVNCPIGVHKSLSYKVYERRKHLKAEFHGLSQHEIKQISATKGADILTESYLKNIISYSGDTPVDNYDRFDGSELLIHEATFLHSEGEDQVQSRDNRHSRIDEVLKMASEIQLEKLILCHFSSRYDRNDIDTCLKRLLKEYHIDIPIYLIYPGQIHRDILNSEPFNA